MACKIAPSTNVITDNDHQKPKGCFDRYFGSGRHRTEPAVSAEERLVLHQKSLDEVEFPDLVPEYSNNRPSPFRRTNTLKKITLNYEAIPKVDYVHHDNTTLVFCYGSNSTQQLAVRVESPHLVSYPAVLKGYVRCFCRDSKRWHGGVASLAPANNPEEDIYGSFVALTKKELQLLASHESGYRQVKVTLNIGKDLTKQMPAIAFVAGEEGITLFDGAFTQTMNEPPSEQYLWAIYGNLREFWVVDTLVIRSYDVVNGPRVIKEWTRPPSAKLLSLQALCVEVSLNHDIHWMMPKTIDIFIEKLEKIGITSTDQLVQALTNEVDLNAQLKEKGVTHFHHETIVVLKNLLLTKKKSSKGLIFAPLLGL